MLRPRDHATAAAQVTRPLGERAMRQRLLAGLPVEERRVVVDGVDTCVLEGGDGSPVVLLHGGIECGGVYWAPVVEALARRHRLVVPDVPGLGASAPVPRLRQEVFESWLAELIQLSCEEPPLLVAHSLLGSLSARYAVRHGGLLRELVVYAAPGVGPYRMPVGLRAAAIRFALRPTEANAQRLQRWAIDDYDRVRLARGDWFEAFTGYLRSRAGVPHVERTMRQVVGVGTRRIDPGVLRAVRVPTALVWGRQDRFVPLRLALDAAAATGWGLRVVDGAGHVPHIERPEAFVDALTAATTGWR